MKEAQEGSILASNLGAFAPESHGPAVRALLSSVDFFSLWTVCLMIIGYRLAAKVSTHRGGGRGAGRSGPSTSPSRSVWRRFSAVGQGSLS